MLRLTRAMLLLLAGGAMSAATAAAEDSGPLSVGVFRVDATPPLGTAAQWPAAPRSCIRTASITVSQSGCRQVLLAPR